jgi:hypothetical protein
LAAFKRSFYGEIKMRRLGWRGKLTGPEGRNEAVRNWRVLSEAVVP